MRVTFDSNAWETIFSSGDSPADSVRVALQKGSIEGFICEATFRIEAITRRARASYFAQPYIGSRLEIKIVAPHTFALVGSIGPDDSMHPGLPAPQRDKLQVALQSGIKLMDGQNWMGLPRPPEICDRKYFIVESESERHQREERQLAVYAAIESRGAGKASFDAADGWTNRPRTAAEEKHLARACAEWADGELVVAHIAYRNEILCTNDRAGRSGRSIFDVGNCAWLATAYGVAFMTLQELSEKVAT